MITEMKRWWSKGIAFSFVLVLFLLITVSPLSTITPVSAEDIPTELQGMAILSDSNLIFGLDTKTGMGKVYDKRTGQIWTQYAATPPTNATITPVPLSDQDYWIRDGATFDRNNPRADEGVVLFELSEDFAGGSIKTVDPGQKIIRGNYRIDVTYTAENAADFGLDITVGFRSNYYDYKDGFQHYMGTERGDTFISTGEKNGTFTYSMELSEAAFREQTSFATIKVDVLGGGSNAKGKIYIEKIVVVSLGGSGEAVVLSDVVKKDNALTFKVNTAFRVADKQPAFQGEIFFDRGDLVYTVSSASISDSFDGRLLFPGTFHNNSETTKWVLPNNSGAYLSPFDLDSDINKKLSLGELYYNASLSMAFIGADDGANGGYLEIIDTPVLAGAVYPLCDIGGKAGYLPVVTFEGDKYQWGENRQVRYRFLENGNYVNLAKEYRKIADEKGFLVTYKEKAEKNPIVLQSTGAHRVDLGIDKRAVPNFFARMKEAGITNVMVSISGVRDMENNNKMSAVQTLIDDGIFTHIKENYPEYLLYQYEFYRESVTGDYPDIVRPDGYTEFANDYISVNARGIQRTWYAYDNPDWVARVLCPTVSIPYIDFMWQLFPYEKFPVKARMYDTLATAPNGEGQCNDPDHPCDRRTTYKNKWESMKYLTEKYGIDAHTEGAAEYLVPYVNSFEGSIDLLGLTGYGFLLIPGREMSRKFPNEAEKIPLWQLVFHDCGSTYWHWEYGELDEEEMNAYCDLYTMLYGEKGVFLTKYNKTHVYSTYFDKMIERINTLNQVTQQVCYDEMLTHEFLSDDGKVQQTTFTSGMKVTVNFSKDKSYTINGKTIEPMSYQLDGVKGNSNTDGTKNPFNNNSDSGYLWLYVATGCVLVLIVGVTAVAIIIKRRKNNLTE